MGLMFGNTVVETGGIAQEQIREGEYERGDILQKGITKGAVITGLDVATIGATKWLFGAAAKASNKEGCRICA